MSIKFSMSKDIGTWVTLFSELMQPLIASMAEVAMVWLPSSKIDLCKTMSIPNFKIKSRC